MLRIGASASITKFEADSPAIIDQMLAAIGAPSCSATVVPTSTLLTTK